MSSFIVSPEHLRALVLAGLAGQYQDGAMRWYSDDGNRSGVLDNDTAARVFEMLYRANVEAVEYRYGSDNPDGLPGYIGPDPYRFTFASGFTPDPVSILKAVACYEYQACDAPTWNASEARDFCQALRLRMIHRLEGIDDAPWCVDSISDVARR